MTRFGKMCFVLFLVISISAHGEIKTPYIFILGVAQDAGFPQAGCYKAHCMEGWNNKEKRLSATSLAVIDNENQKKYLIEATPNLPEQLFLLEREAPNHDLDGIFITHAHMGHYTGLMHLGREAMGAKKVPVYTMPRMKNYLENNGPWSQLVTLENVQLRALKSDSTIVLNKNIKVTPLFAKATEQMQS